MSTSTTPAGTTRCGLRWPSAAQPGFTVGEFTAEAHALTGHSDTSYSIRQAAYDLRKLRAKDLVDKSGRTRRYRVAPLAARTIAALLTVRDQVIAPILAGIRSPEDGPQARALDSRGPRLRTDPDPRANSLHRSRSDHAVSRLRIPRNPASTVGNNLSVPEPQAASR
jgi:hypothetical protein